MSEVLQKLKKSYERSPFFQHIGFEFVHLEAGRVKIKLRVHEALRNTQGVLHGGVHATMIDNIIGMTIRSISESSCVTIQLNTHYLAPVRDGTIFAAGKVIRHGKTIVTGEGEITDEDGHMLAKGSGTFKLIKG